jgi:hypothetical protein
MSQKNRVYTDFSIVNMAIYGIDKKIPLFSGGVFLEQERGVIREKNLIR